MPLKLSLISGASRLLLRLLSKSAHLCNVVAPKRYLLACSLLRCGPGFRPGKAIEISNPAKVAIGDNFSCGHYVRLHAWTKYNDQALSDGPDPLITLGKNIFINSNSYISAAGGVCVGDDCLIGSNVLITDNGHGPSVLDERPRRIQPLAVKGRILIGSNVWICNNVVIVSGVVVGANSIIAANSVVTSDVPTGALYGGVPARLIKYLSQP